MAKSGPSDVLVREATHDDLPDILLLGDEYARDTIWSRLDTDLERYAEFLIARLAADDAKIIVAEVDGAVCGYAIAVQELLHSKIPNGGIYQIYANKVGRKAGVYGRMIEAAVKVLEGWGVGMIHVAIVPGYDDSGKSVKQAENLFKKHGFEVGGTVMRKVL